METTESNLQWSKRSESIWKEEKYAKISFLQFLGRDFFIIRFKDQPFGGLALTGSQMSTKATLSLPFFVEQGVGKI